MARTEEMSSRTVTNKHVGQVVARTRNDDTRDDPLLAGFFTISEAAALVGESQAVVRGWLNGYANSKVGPIVQRDFGGTRTVSFLDLMELRFVSFFRKQGVRMQTLRCAAERARHDWCVTHPLAMSNEKYLTDRCTVFAQAAHDEDDMVTWDMATGQYEMWTVIERSIAQGVVYEPRDDLPISWKPKPNEFSTVVIDPRIAFGRATIEGTWVPTSVIFSQWKAEDRNESAVADWYGVAEEAVKQAVRYELALAA